MKLLDTDIFIDFLCGKSEAVTLFNENVDEIIFSAITEAELLSGKSCSYSKEREKLLHFISQFEKIPVDNPLVQIAAEIRREYNTSIADAIIAASAITKDAILITRNLKDFEKIKNLKFKKPY